MSKKKSKPISKPIPKVTRPEQWEIYKRKTNTPGVLDLGDGQRVRLDKTVTILKDKGLAEAVNQRYGVNKGTRASGDVLVVPVSNNHLHEPGERGHRYTHTVPELPWQKGRKRYWEQE